MLSAQILGSLKSLHIEAIDWHNRVVSNGGSVSPTTLKAVSNFCRSIDGAGIRSKFLRLNLFCGNNLNACFTPLYLGPNRSTQYGFTNQDQNNGPFISSDYTERGSGGGLSGNNAFACYLNTGLSTTTPYTNMGMAYNDIHASVYLSALGTTEGWMGGVIGGNVFGFESNEYPGVTVFWGYTDYTNWNSPMGTYVSNTSYSNEGLIIGNIKSGNNAFLIKNINATDSSGVNTTTAQYTGTNTYIMQSPIGFGMGGNPEPTFGSTDDTVAAYSLGLGFSSSEATAYYNAMNSFQTVLGRNV
jgi:hypothetical protein